MLERCIDQLVDVYMLIIHFSITLQGSQRSIGTTKKKRKNRWGRIKKRWNRKGVVEVDIDHHRFELLNCIRDGIRDVVTNHPELGPKVSYKPELFCILIEG